MQIYVSGSHVSSFTGFSWHSCGYHPVEPMRRDRLIKPVGSGRLSFTHHFVRQIGASYSVTFIFYMILFERVYVRSVHLKTFFFAFFAFWFICTTSRELSIAGLHFHALPRTTVKICLFKPTHARFVLAYPYRMPLSLSTFFFGPPTKNCPVNTGFQQN